METPTEVVFINGVPYKVNPACLSQASAFFQQYFSPTWKQTPIIIEHPYFIIEESHISNILAHLQGPSLDIKEDFHIYHYLLTYLQAKDCFLSELKVKAWEILRCGSPLEDLLISLYLYKPKLITNIPPNIGLLLLSYPGVDPDDIGNKLSHVSLYQYEKALVYTPRLEVPKGWLVYKASTSYLPGVHIPPFPVFQERLRKFSCGLSDDLPLSRELVLGGGSLLLFLNPALNMDNYPYVDIDIFVYGSSHQYRHNKMKEVLGIIKRRFKAQGVLVFQNKGTVTIIVRGVKRNFQIVDTGKSSWKKMWVFCDNTINQMCYDGSEVWCSGPALVALATQSTVFPAHHIELGRLYKLHKRGLDIIYAEDAQVRGDETYTALQFQTSARDPAVTRAKNKYIHITDESQKRVLFLVRAFFSKNYEHVEELGDYNEEESGRHSYYNNDTTKINVQTAERFGDSYVPKNIAPLQLLRKIQNLPHKASILAGISLNTVPNTALGTLGRVVVAYDRMNLTHEPIYLRGCSVTIKRYEEGKKYRAVVTLNKEHISILRRVQETFIESDIISAINMHLQKEYSSSFECNNLIPDEALPSIYEVSDKGIRIYPHIFTVAPKLKRLGCEVCFDNRYISKAEELRALLSEERLCHIAIYVRFGYSFLPGGKGRSWFSTRIRNMCILPSGIKE